MNKAERKYIKLINMCALYTGGKRKSRKLSKVSKGRIPARKAAKLWRESLAFRAFVKQAKYTQLYGNGTPTLIVHDELQLVDLDFLQLERRVINWQLTH